MDVYKGYSRLTKTRYRELINELEQTFNESTVSDVINIVKRVMKFDPNSNTYDEVKEKLDKKREDGISSYQALNQKKYYEKNKIALNKKRYEKEKEKRKNT